ncbi:hypothetical protein HXX76_010944 [Chlamydomonas incerta]|uniref:Uncharacterized protein n=1 Tax=Chlamydomonas incerta TaxID=51695 RepID=A0A835VRX8_CHLIN|nr:hypothetical protein HXX76_010944 [Chlamydomonas incerta]|eukprot:KAG2423176.1 hypothetical protein HXX76_010944 [Chlamydomonas incerta]
MDSSLSSLHPEILVAIAKSLHVNDLLGGFPLSCKAVFAALSSDPALPRAFRLAAADTTKSLRVYGRRFYLRDFDEYVDAQLAYWQDAPRAERPWPGAAFIGHWDRPEFWRSLSLAQRRRLLLLAASSGHPASLEVAIRRCGVAEPPAQPADSAPASLGEKECYFRGALAVGDLRCADILWSAGFRHHDNIHTAVPAAVMGGLEACQWLLARPADPGSVQLLVLQLAECAAFTGREGQLDWLLEQDQELASSELPHLAYCAALGGHVGTMQRLRARPGNAWPGDADMRLLAALVRGVAPLPVVEEAAAQLLGGVGVAVEAAVEAEAGTAVAQRVRLVLAAALSYSHDWAAKLGWQALAPPTANEMESWEHHDLFTDSCSQGVPADFVQRMLRLLDIPGFGCLEFRIATAAIDNADVPAVRLLAARSPGARDDIVYDMSQQLSNGTLRLPAWGDLGAPACELLHELGLELNWQHVEAARSRSNVPVAAWMAKALVARGRLPDVTADRIKHLAYSLLERGDDVGTVLGFLGVRDGPTNDAYRAFMRNLDAAHGLASLAVGGSVVALEDYVGRMAALGVALRPLEPGMVRKAAANQAAMDWLRGRGLLLAQQGV